MGFEAHLECILFYILIPLSSRWTSLSVCVFDVSRSDAPVADVRAALKVGAHSLCPLFRRLAKLLRKSTNSKRKSVDARLEVFAGEKFDALTAEQVRVCLQSDALTARVCGCVGLC